MALAQAKSVADALAELGILGGLALIVEPVAHTPSPGLAERLELTRRLGYDRTEAGRAEGLIFPILLDVWAHFLGKVHVWREPTVGEGRLSGEPDYVLTRTTLPGPFVLTPPFGAVVEAKQEKFDEGWGQCVAAMVAARELNGASDLAVFGIVTTGHQWEFGRLLDGSFLRHPDVFSLTDLPGLCAAIRFVFETISRYPAPLTGKAA
jgi:hypothetical protein